MENIKEVQFEAGQYLYKAGKGVTEVFVIIKGIFYSHIT